ncbi:MAG: DoxX family protein [Acidobacteria bacterium 13_1_40CM_3_65_5]|nr:MAG: DoxX family protein [Acidobacteria bacterium 13_1_40CM_3_65_5]
MKLNLSRFAPYLLSALRIAAAAIFIPHGTQKLFYFPNAPHPALPWFSQIWFAGVLEVFGGALILLGLFSRPVAFLLAGEMAVAYFQEHLPRGPWPILNEGELAVLFFFIWLYFVAAGPGPWSLDAIVRKRR